MNWADDPEVRKAVARNQARSSLIRSALIWTPFLVLFGAALIWAIFDRVTNGGTSTWFLVVIVSILTFLFGFQAIQPLWDLASQPVTTTGFVSRRWSRSDSFVVRSHYIRIDGKTIFRIDRDLHGQVAQGDYLQIEHYPHSATIIEVNKLPAPERPPEPDPEMPKRIKGL